MGGQADDGYLRAVQPREFRFPQDHGAHTGFQTEWWYVTGNLDGEDGRRFGFQWTLFRIALRPDAPESSSAWRVSHIWMGHFALSDGASGRHLSFERFSREALGLTGVEGEPPRVWLENWSMNFAAEPWRLQAETPEIGLDLNLSPLGGVVLQGDRGLSQKSSAPGNASYYYSVPRLQASGRIRLNGKELAVSGLAWLDREWSTSALGPDQQGWDWFSLQLDDGSDLMYYRLRRAGGSTDPHSAGTLRTAEGEVVHLGSTDVELRPSDSWTSPEGTVYPVAWQMSIPSRSLELTIKPLIPDQEMRLRVRYWEGAVDVSGSRQGRGYLELAGYASGS
ncbi:MAG: carotenoid 1,2-hydratase [Chromatiales bacterium]|nr:carotenoid 1,2-hydratase [Chromatiales bacterium]